jgi:glyoxylase-like metal-dependent hydrolase (beta-lactamase superfamily II)
VTKRPTVTDLGGGVHQVTLPLPWALDHVHTYAVADSGGWTLIDAGIGTPGTAERWRQALVELGSPTVRRVIATHYHPDHNGGSGQLVELTGAAEFAQGRLDHDLTYPGFLDPEGPPKFEHFLTTMGMPAELARTSAEDEREVPYRPAEPTRLLDEGDTIDLGGESFRVHHLPGHAEGHVVFVGERTRRMFGGDTILNEITPNVGLWEESSADPLADFATSLLRIRDEFAPTIVYPGHRTLIVDAAGRVNELLAHHEARLDTCAAALVDATLSPYQLARHLWGDRLDYHQVRFAMVESAAHLVRLVALDRAAEVDRFRYAAV